MSHSNSIRQITLCSSPTQHFTIPPTPLESFPLSSSPLASPTAILQKFGGKTLPEKPIVVPKREENKWEITDGCLEECEVIPLKVKQRRVIGKTGIKKSDPSIARKPAKPKASSKSRAKSSTVLEEKSVNKDFLDETKSEYFQEQPAKRKRTTRKIAELPSNKKVTTDIVSEPLLDRAHKPIPPKLHIPQRRKWTPVKDTIKSSEDKENNEHCAKSFRQRIEELKFYREASVNCERVPCVGLECEHAQRLATRKRTTEVIPRCTVLL